MVLRKIHDSYRTSIQVLTKIIQAKFEIEYDTTITQHINLHNLYCEFTSELSIITASHPDKDLTVFQEEIAKIIDEPTGKNTFYAQSMITQIMEHDSRIKDLVVLHS